ncbi:MAG: hypothetical protein ACLUYV_02335 [Alistipes shahii]
MAAIVNGEFFFASIHHQEMLCLVHWAHGFQFQAVSNFAQQNNFDHPPRVTRASTKFKIAKYTFKVLFYVKEWKHYCGSRQRGSSIMEESWSPSM